MGRARAILACTECGQRAAQWAGRCGACGAWGSISEQAHPTFQAAGGLGAKPAVLTLATAERRDPRVRTGISGVDRVLGGGLVPGSVVLLAGEPGIGKSTLLLQLMSRLSAAGLTCLLASGEESYEQVADRAGRLGVSAHEISFVSGRDLAEVVAAARAKRPAVLAVDSIQTVRDPDSSSLPGGPSQVRWCADALVGLAKAEGVSIILTGHVTKDGDLAGPRTLEHAVDVVLSFEGDVRSGLRVLGAGKNRFGAEGEVAWFEMSHQGLVEVEPSRYLASGGGYPGAATALPMAGRRALACEVQALSVPTEGPPRRRAAGLDDRRLSLVAAVLQASGFPLGKFELFGASSGGLRIDDPGCDLAVAAAVASAVSGRPAPANAAFAGEVALTGQVRPTRGMPQRVAAAVAAGLDTVFAGGTEPSSRADGRERSRRPGGVRTIPVRHVGDALSWARPPDPTDR
jgi:DNA repair protein RadA/Sms